MKAIVCERYGPPEVLQLKELDRLTPKDNEILIKTHATTVTSGDWRVRSLNVPAGFGLIMRLVLGFSKPRQPILGTELAGVVESVGKDVTNFKVGDQVFAFSDASMGCHAEYKCMPQDGLVVTKPANLSNEEAAALAFGDTYDVIIDTAGTAPFSRWKGSLKEGGRLLMVLAGLPDMLLALGMSMTSSKRIIAGPAFGRLEDLRLLAELAEAGEFKPVIDRCYPFEQFIEAHRYVDTGRKRGNVVLTLGHDDRSPDYMPESTKSTAATISER